MQKNIDVGNTKLQMQTNPKRYILKQERYALHMISRKKPKQIKITPIGLNGKKNILLDNSDEENDQNILNNSLISYHTPAVKIKTRRAIQLREIDSPEILDFDVSSVNSEASDDEAIHRQNENIAIFSTPSFGRTKRITTPPPPKERRAANR